MVGQFLALSKLNMVTLTSLRVGLMRRQGAFDRDGFVGYGID